MKKFLIASILFLGVNYLFALSGTKLQYQVISSSGITPITFDTTSTEVYVLKLSTMSAFVCWTSSAMPMTAYTTNYFMLPETDTNNVYEFIQEFATHQMAIFQPLVVGTTQNINIRVQIKMR